jgi:HK97 family phage portal protein
MFNRLRAFFAPETRALDLTSAAVLLGNMQTAAGPSVTAETAMRSPTALACVRALAETAGMLPVHVYRRGAGGEKARASDHPADQLLNGFANPWTPAPQLRTQLAFDAVLRGAGFARVVRVGGAVRELHRLEPSAVTVTLADDGEPEHRFQPKAGGAVPLSWRDVLHVHTPGADITRPLALIDAAREAIGLDIAMAGHQSRIFRNGGRPSGALKVPKGTRLAPETLARIKASWQAAHAGENSGGTALLEDGLEFEQLTLSAVDLQFLELRRFVVEEIARALRVPAVLINDLERATWRNVEELARLFLTFGLLPWLEMLQGAFTRALLTEAERADHFIEFVVDDLLRADIETRFAAYREATGGAWLTPNEARALENRSPIDGGDALILQAGQGGATDGTA